MRVLNIVLWLVLGPNIFIHCKRLRFGEDKQYVADSHDILGKGFSGTVFRAVNIKKNNRAVAVKTERVSGNRQNQKATLPLEIENYKRIGRHLGIPEYYFTGTTSDGRYHVMVMQLLRSSLEDLQKKRTNSQFTPKTVFMIGIQLLERIQYIHSKNLVQRDIKPGNVGIGNTGTLIYLYDFGTSQLFRNSNGHIKEGKRNGHGSGNPRTRSSYADTHLVQSRRDDMEAIGLTLMLFLRGDLPWDKYRHKPNYKTNVAYMKQDLSTLWYPKMAWQMAEYMKYVRKLDFYAEPDYEYLRQLFVSALADMGQTEDFNFDWPTNKNQ